MRISMTRTSRRWRAAEAGAAQDFIKYGLIPEFIGRVPINVALDELDEEAMIRILVEPKNSLVKQYQALFAMDHVNLIFEAGSSGGDREEVDSAEDRGQRAAGYQENVMMDYMYHVPSDKSIIRWLSQNRWWMTICCWRRKNRRRRWLWNRRTILQRRESCILSRGNPAGRVVFFRGREEKLWRSRRFLSRRSAG